MLNLGILFDVFFQSYHFPGRKKANNEEQSKLHPSTYQIDVNALRQHNKMNHKADTNTAPEI